MEIGVVRPAFSNVAADLWVRNGRSASLRRPRLPRDDGRTYTLFFVLFFLA